MPTVTEMLTQAQRLHQAGQLHEAEHWYRQVLQAEPAHCDALSLLGALRGALDDAAGAAALFQRLVDVRPDYPRAYFNLGIAKDRQGDTEAALRCFRQATAVDPSHAEAYFVLGVQSAKQGDMETAIACYRRAIELKPTYANAYNNLGNLLEGRDDAAAGECFRRAIHCDPQFAEAYSNLGAYLGRQRDFDGAIQCFQRALQLRPDHADIHYNLAMLLEKAGQLDAAAAGFQHAMRLRPDNVDALSNLGAIYEKQDQLDAAAECFRRALALRPDSVEAQCNLGVVFERQGRFAEAVDSFRRSLALDPKFVDAHFNLAVMLLMARQFDEGWREYEWRCQREGTREEPLAQPRWAGESLAGKTILLRCEQGLGDTLQFVRYAPQVKQLGGMVIVECAAALSRLVATCQGVDQVVVRGQTLPSFDVHLPLMSLPYVFHTSLETIPGNVPYVQPDEELVEQWRRELAGDESFKVGIVWQGSRTHRADRLRSIPLAEFAPLADVPGVKLYSLQMGDGREQLNEAARNWPIVDLGDRVGDFYNTAAIMRNLELVISCDSAPAHVAGAIGVPVWLAVTFVPDWRWMLERDDSPWYPTMRLFRQVQRQDWSAPFQQMRLALAELTRR